MIASLYIKGRLPAAFVLAASAPFRHPQLNRCGCSCESAVAGRSFDAIETMDGKIGVVLESLQIPEEATCVSSCGSKRCVRLCH